MTTVIGPIRFASGDTRLIHAADRNLNSAAQWTIGVVASHVTTTPQTPLTFVWTTTVRVKPLETGNLRLHVHAAVRLNDAVRTAERRDPSGDIIVPLVVTSSPSLLGLSDAAPVAVELIASIVGLAMRAFLLLQMRTSIADPGGD